LVYHIFTRDKKEKKHLDWKYVEYSYASAVKGDWANWNQYLTVSHVALTISCTALGSYSAIRVSRRSCLTIFHRARIIKLSIRRGGDRVFAMDTSRQQKDR